MLRQRGVCYPSSLPSRKSLLACHGYIISFFCTTRNLYDTYNIDSNAILRVIPFFVFFFLLRHIRLAEFSFFFSSEFRRI